MTESVNEHSAAAPLLDVVYADRKLVVINKPSGLLSVPGKGPEGADNVVARVQAMYPECRRHPTVHRLDMDTSGLMVLGLTARATRELVAQFQARTVAKEYLAELEGVPAFAGRPVRPGDKGVIELPLGPDPDRAPGGPPRHRVDHENGRRAVTRWRVETVSGDRARIRFTLETGRSHQLRIHAAHPDGLGVPIVGDRLYGTGDRLDGDRPGQLRLHACLLRFDHPKTGETLTFTSDPLF